MQKYYTETHKTQAVSTPYAQYQLPAINREAAKTPTRQRPKLEDQGLNTTERKLESVEKGTNKAEQARLSAKNIKALDLKN